MTIKKENKLWMAAITVFILVYFAWIYVWQHHGLLRTTGGNLLAILGTFIPSIWLWSAYRRSTSKTDRTYWILLFLSTVNYFLASLCWFTIEFFSLNHSSLTDLYEIFYIFSGFLKFFAFAYRICTYGNKSILTKFFFDIAVVMTVSITFCWSYLIAPILEQGSMLTFSLAVSLFYPLGDLVLLLCVATFYFGENYFYHRRSLFFILTGMLLHIFSDIVYFIGIIQQTYYSGHWIDPLFILPIMLIGYTALIERESEDTASKSYQSSKEEIFTMTRMTLPYFLVVFLFFFVVFQSNGFSAISLGSGISIILVIIRQFTVITDNRKLLKQYHQKAEELELSEERYKSLFEYHTDSVFSLDLKGSIESLNSAGVDLMGYDQNTLIGSSITDFIDAPQKEKAMNDFSKVKDGWIQNHEYTITSKHGKVLCINMTHIPILVKNKLVGIFGIGKDVTVNKSNEEKVRFYAYHDYLTGLANRRLFEEKSAHKIKQADLTSEPFALLFLDLNRFKQINDMYGHKTGDKLLTAIADRIKTVIGENDLAARLGGDEFCLLLENVSEQTIQETIADFSDLLSQPYIINQTEVICSASIGAVCYPTDGKTLAELLGKADRAMYEEKKGVKDNIY